MARADGDARLPVTLLAGFLGAGKTTFVNRILTRPGGEPTAVLVNEFGAVPVDGSLVVSSGDEVVELTNGCVCCTIRGDLVRAIGDLLRKRRRKLLRRAFERLLIETSGLASPGPVLQTLVVESELAQETRPAGVVTLAHAACVEGELREHPEVAEQVGYADVLVLNHADRASETEMAAARRALRAVNSVAPIHTAVRAEVDATELLAVAEAAPGRFDPASPEGGHAHGHGAGSVVLRSAVPLQLERLKMWLAFLTNKRAHELWRLKGIVRCVDVAEPVVVQSVYQWLELGPGEGTAPEESCLVLIGRGLDQDELGRGWKACQG